MVWMPIPRVDPCDVSKGRHLRTLAFLLSIASSGNNFEHRTASRSLRCSPLRDSSPHTGRRLTSISPETLVVSRMSALASTRGQDLAHGATEIRAVDAIAGPKTRDRHLVVCLAVLRERVRRANEWLIAV